MFTLNPIMLFNAIKLATFARKVLDRVKYKDWRFQVRILNGLVFLRPLFRITDASTQSEMKCVGRDYVILPSIAAQMTRDQLGEFIVRTARVAIRDSEECSRDLLLEVDGTPLFGPVHGLVEADPADDF